MYRVTGCSSDWSRIVSILQRRHELRQLIRWTKRKRLTRPLKLYQNRLLDEELRLNYYALRYPRLTRILRWLFWFSVRLIPSPRHYRKGMAAKYRIRRLTTSPNLSYSYTYTYK